MRNFHCPFCDSVFFLDSSTYRARRPSFNSDDWKGVYSLGGYPNLGKSGLVVEFYNCPRCEKVSINVSGKGSQFSEGYSQWFYPRSKSKQFPEFVPQVIREDYEEAYSIVDLSPKASATLSRRCIQGMIRDSWKVTEGTLYKEIEAIRDQIAPEVFSALNSMRNIGNIGAHTERDISLIIDIDPGEAEKLLKLVEMLVHDWYIVPHERAKLLEEIQTIGSEKEAQRSTSPEG